LSNNTIYLLYIIFFSAGIKETEYLDSI
jgi:hypothetical protein